MVDLLEITPSARTVSVKGNEVDVPGLSVGGIAFLIKKHPDLIEIAKNGGFEGGNIQELIDMGVDVMASVLATGLGHPGDKKAEELCKTFGPEDVWNVGHAIIEESFPGGVQSFFDKVTAAVTQFGSVSATVVTKTSAKKKTRSRGSRKVASG